MTTNGRYTSERISELLVGGKIERSIVDENEGFPGFLVSNKGKNFLVWVSMDSEGNGPGWLDIEEVTAAGKEKG